MRTIVKHVIYRAKARAKSQEAKKKLGEASKIGGAGME